MTNRAKKRDNHSNRRMRVHIYLAFRMLLSFNKIERGQQTHGNPKQNRNQKIKSEQHENTLRLANRVLKIRAN